MSEGKRQPVLKLRHRSLAATVWANDHEGATFYSGSITRSYKDRETDGWKETSSLDSRDFPAAAALLLEAFRRLEIKEPTAKTADSPAPKEEPLPY